MSDSSAAGILPYTYLLVNLLSMLFPFLFSFHPRLRFSRHFGPVFTAITAIALPFLVWDHFFTAAGNWSFSPRHTLGPHLFALPLEEVLFFFCIPFACLFIYHVLKVTKTRLPLPEAGPRAALFPAAVGALALGLLLLAALHLERAYTAWVFSLSGLALLLGLRIWTRERWSFFLAAYLFHLIPFFLVNGILTSLPVVSYNDAENLGIRIYTIPVEDMAYSFLLLFGNMALYEFLLERRRRADPRPGVSGAKA